MHNTYGYIRRTEGVDGDHIDVFLSDNPASGSVFVVDQVNPESGAFDEHKVMYGFASEEEAREAYLSNYSEGWQGLGAITEVSREEFKKWVESSHRKTKPFAEYKSVKTAAQEVQQNILKQLGDLQDNGKQYEENKEEAFELGRKFASTLPEGTTSKEALRVAAEALDANKAKGGVYALQFFDGVTGNINSAENFSNIANEGTDSENNELPLPNGWDRLPTYDIDNKTTGDKIKGLKTLLNENYQELLKAYSSYGNSNRGSLVGLQQARTALRRELDERARKFKEWQDKYNIDKQGKISLDDLSRLFHDHNRNKNFDKLFEKVVEVVKQIGLDIQFDEKLNAAGSSNYNGEIRYNTGNITSSGYNGQDIATLILHELIHSVTQSTVAAQKSGGKYATHLTDSQKEAAQKIIDTFYELKAWAEKNGYKDTYGFKNPHEMLAEMASQNFRYILKSIKTKEKKSLWEILKDALHGIFSLTKETDAEKVVIC